MRLKHNGSTAAAAAAYLFVASHVVAPVASTLQRGEHTVLLKFLLQVT
jgi:hypothetical protein